jgi:dihydrofolate reductase
MIMGRKTFDSLPGLLDGRRHIVLTHNSDWAEDGAEVAHNVAEALKLANAPHVAVIGGAQIYAAFLDMADRIELTHIHAEPAGDTHIALPDPAQWEESCRTEHSAHGQAPAFDFITYKRRG